MFHQDTLTENPPTEIYQVQDSQRIDSNPEQALKDHSFIVDRLMAKLRGRIPSEIDLDDLRAIGMARLWRAIQDYVPQDSIPFVAYARGLVKCAVIDEMRKHDKRGRGGRRRAQKFNQTVQELSLELRREPFFYEIRERLGLTAEEFDKWRKDSVPLVFLDFDHKNDFTGTSLAEIIPDHENVDSRETAERIDLIEVLRGKIAKLPKHYQRFIHMHYVQKMCFLEIAREFRVTPSNISFLKTRIVKVLQSQMVGVN